MLQKENTVLRLKLDQLENHSQKCNVQVLGMEKVIEAGNLTKFINNFFCDLFGKENVGVEEVLRRVGPGSEGGRRGREESGLVSRGVEGWAWILGLISSVTCCATVSLVEICLLGSLFLL